MLSPCVSCVINILTFVSRNETYCVTGTIKLQVYEPGSVDMDKLSYPFPVILGQSRTIFCPWLDDFNKTDTLIRWDKVRGKKYLKYWLLP